MLYTVQNFVAEDTKIIYNDGAKKLFLYVGGKLGGNEELKNLLHYFSKSDIENAADTDIRRLHSIVETVRGNQEMGERYMTVQDMIDYEKKESFEDGVLQGREEGIINLVNSLKKFNIPKEAILQNLMESYTLSLEGAETYLN